MVWTLTQTEYRNLKSRLTRAINSKDHAKVIAECDRAMAIFEDKGYPDSWSRWQRAKEDAITAQRFAKKTMNRE
jgi:hypothetical protein